MVVAHIIGRGAPELVRFFGESALVREPDVLLFGLQRVDPPEQEFLTRSPMRHVYAADVQLQGAAKSAADALAHLHADAREFILHLDTDVIAQEDFSAVNIPDSGGLRLDDVRAALKQIVRSKNLLGFDVAQYNPDKDPDGSGAKTLVDLIVEALAARLESTDVPATEATLQGTVGAKAPAETRPETLTETHATGSTTAAVPQTVDQSSDGQSTDERPSAETSSSETSI
jgi:arginase family enzyme